MCEGLIIDIDFILGEREVRVCIEEVWVGELRKLVVIWLFGYYELW